MMPFSDEDLSEAVKNVIESKVKPMLALDGGGIEFIKVKEGVVYVQLTGACVGCSSSGNTLKFGVEKELKSLIHPDLDVVNVPFGQEGNI
jgi:Fe-S cluster biogenesis protein NfuA